MDNSHGLNIIILGGGTAGWVAGAVFSKQIQKLGYCVTVIDTADIPTIGVGEASIPTLYRLLDDVGLNDADLIKHAEASFKYGIEFENWSRPGEKYMHGFGNMGTQYKGIEFFKIWLSTAKYLANRDLSPFIPSIVGAYADKFARVAIRPKNANENMYFPLCELSYALHFDAALLAKQLRTKAIENGAKHLSKHITDIETDGHGITALRTSEGETLTADFFIDCSGISGAMIQQALGQTLDDWSQYLPCNRAIAVQTKLDKPPRLYTRSVAHEAGWRWEIQLQSRTGNGIVYCSDHMSDDAAQAMLLRDVEGDPINTPRIIPFTTGRLPEPWTHNCAAIGLSAGFLEPLESTSIHLIYQYALNLREALERPKFEHMEARQAFNKSWREETEEVRDFLMAHYVINQREEPFWRERRSAPRPSSFTHYLDEISQTGWNNLPAHALFGNDSWFEVLVGQKFEFDYERFATTPEQAQQFAGFLNNVARAVQTEIVSVPHTHQTKLNELRT